MKFTNEGNKSYDVQSNYDITLFGCICSSEGVMSNRGANGDGCQCSNGEVNRKANYDLAT